MSYCCVAESRPRDNTIVLIVIRSFVIPILVFYLLKKFDTVMPISALGDYIFLSFVLEQSVNSLKDILINILTCYDVRAMKENANILFSLCLLTYPLYPLLHTHYHVHEAGKVFKNGKTLWHNTGNTVNNGYFLSKRQKRIFSENFLLTEYLCSPPLGRWSVLEPIPHQH